MEYEGYKLVRKEDYMVYEAMIDGFEIKIDLWYMGDHLVERANRIIKNHSKKIDELIEYCLNTDIYKNSNLNLDLKTEMKLIKPKIILHKRGGQSLYELRSGHKFIVEFEDEMDSYLWVHIGIPSITWESSLQSE